MIRAKPKRAFLIDISLPSAPRADLKGSARGDRHASCIQPTMPGASLSLTEIVHFHHCVHPPNGGRTDVYRGSL